MFNKKYFFALTWTLILAAFTVYVLLDTFVIARGRIVSDDDYYDSLFDNAEKSTLDDTAPNGRQGDEKGNGDKRGRLTDTEEAFTDTSISNGAVSEIGSYGDENISVTVTKHRKYDTDIYVAEVYLSSMKYFKTAFANDTYGRNVTVRTSETAKAKNAILAVNGDYYGARSEGFVIRNGKLYRDTPSYDREALVINTNGEFTIVKESESSAAELIDHGAAHVFSFGPSLVRNGEISLSQKDEYGRSATNNPRTAIGITDKLRYVFVTADGRTRTSRGLTIRQLAEFMTDLGVWTAYNLDGGGSATMYFDGKVINNPTTNGRSICERSVSDIVYIGY